MSKNSSRWIYTTNDKVNKEVERATDLKYYY